MPNFSYEHARGRSMSVGDLEAFEGLVASLHPTLQETIARMMAHEVARAEARRPVQPSSCSECERAAVDIADLKRDARDLTKQIREREAKNAEFATTILKLEADVKEAEIRGFRRGLEEAKKNAA